MSGSGSLQREIAGADHALDTVRLARVQGIEWLRVVAAFGIVAYHENVPARDLAYSGLVVFLILSSFVDFHFNWDRRRSLDRLASAILLPWLVWTAIYGAANLATGHAIFRATGFLPGLLFGTGFHLWFLPFIFIVLMALQQAKHRVSPAFLFHASILAGIALVLTSAAWRPESFAWGRPWAQWAHASAGIVLGIAIGLAARVRMGTAIVVAALLVLVANALLRPVAGVSLPYAVGMAVVVAAVWLPFGADRPGFDIQPVSRCMMGVYLVHPLFLTVAQMFFAKGSYAGAALAFGLALGLVFLCLRLFPAAAWVFGVRP